jgi:coenzyme PQQ precursor peptide PqqA
MDREEFRLEPEEWEAPAFEDIPVSAEVTAYMGVLEFDGE